MYTGEVTHFQAGSPINKCSDRAKYTQIETTVSADPYCGFSLVENKQTSKQQSSSNSGFLAISSDVPTIDVKKKQKKRK